MDQINGAGTTESQEDWTIQSIIEAWIADRKISRRKHAYLRQLHEQHVYNEEMQVCPIYMIAPYYICDELEIDHVSNYCYVLAEFLDFLESEKVGHTVTKHKLAVGCCEEEPNPEQFRKELIKTEQSMGFS